MYFMNILLIYINYLIQGTKELKIIKDRLIENINS